MIGWTIFAAVVTLGVLFSPIPPWINQLVLIPRGRVRLAHRVGLLSFQGWRRDRRGAALVAGTQAAFRLPADRREPACRWLENKCRRMHRIRSGGLVGCGLLAALRGDRESARTILRGLERVDREFCSPRAYEIGREWLAADAANEGRWEDVVQIASRTPHQTFATEFLGMVGARLLGDSVYASDAALRRAWQLVPNRRACKPLLDRALASAGRGSRRAALPFVSPKPSGNQSSERALELFIEICNDPEPKETQVRKLSQLWEEQLGDESFLASLGERAEVLGLHVRDPAVAVARSIEEVLSELLDSGDLPVAKLAAGEGMLGRLARSRRKALLAELALRTSRLRGQMEDGAGLDPLDGLHSFLLIVDFYERSIRTGGLDLRREAFTEVCEVNGDFGDWLSAQRRERVLARVVYRWLLEESRVSSTPLAVGHFTGKIAAA
jgi:hypothetical protein